jgi:hypothetical protein
MKKNSMCNRLRNAEWWLRGSGLTLKPLPRVVFSFLLLWTAGDVARADVLNIGTFSLDQFIPQAVNNFTVGNSTGPFALDPDFPVLTSVIFKNSKLVLTTDNGTVLPDVDLGDIGSGFALFGVLGGDLFRSAEFTTTLNVLTLALTDGTSFLANTAALDTLLLPSAGSTLTEGDFALITVTGTRVATPTVPEPATWILVITVLILGLPIRRADWAKTNNQSESR